MSDQQQEPKEKKLPSYDVFFVRPPRQEGEQATWLELGAAWEHADGKGHDVVINVLPVGGWNGRLTLRKREPKKEN